jgi:hypothetical protein
MPAGIHNELLREIERELHDLCQPLTALQCKLELGQMIGEPEALMEAVDGGLEETQRLFTGIAQMRERLLREDAQGRA